MPATGKPSLNLFNGKPSHLVLTTAAADPFSASTTVASVTDSMNPSVTFDGAALWNKGGTPTRLPIKLKGKRTTPLSRGVTDDILPTTGHQRVGRFGRWLFQVPRAKRAGCGKAALDTAGHTPPETELSGVKLPASVLALASASHTKWLCEKV